MQPGGRAFAAAHTAPPPGVPGDGAAHSRLIRLVRLPPLRETRSLTSAQHTLGCESSRMANLLGSDLRFLEGQKKVESEEGAPVE